MPFNFAILFGSRNSRNKGHANIKGFTVFATTDVLSGEVHDLNQTNQPDTVQQMVSYVHVKSAELSLDGVSACIPVSASH